MEGDKPILRLFRNEIEKLIEPRMAHDIQRASEMVSVSYETIRLAVRRHEHPARFVGKKALIEPEDLRTWLRSVPGIPPG